MIRFKGREAVVLKGLKRLVRDFPHVVAESEDLLELYCFLEARKRACTIPLSIPHIRFDPNTWQEQDFINDFRFDRASVELIALFLFGSLEEKQRTYDRDKFTPVEGTCLALRVLMSGARLADHARIFGRSTSGISKIANHVLALLASKVQRIFLHIDENALSSVDFLEAFERVIGFETRITYLVDCKLWETCDFDAALGSLYNGDKKRDGLKSIHLIGPDGMCYFMAGPYHGARHDSGCFGEAGLPHLVNQLWRNKQVRGYGDSAFPRSEALWTNFKRNQMTPEEAATQACLQHARGEIEHFFCVNLNNFRILSNKQELKVGNRPVWDFILCASFLTNCLNCFSPNQISQKFRVAPPPLDLYLQSCLAALE